jgi:hypothetical protein
MIATAGTASGAERRVMTMPKPPSGSLFKRGKWYWFEMVVKGMRHRRTLQTTNPQLAKVRFETLRSAILNGEDLPTFTKAAKIATGTSTTDVHTIIERLADKYAPHGECPPEDLCPQGYRKGCKPDADCRQCWIDTVTKFLEVD